MTTPEERREALCQYIAKHLERFPDAPPIVLASEALYAQAAWNQEHEPALADAIRFSLLHVGQLSDIDERPAYVINYPEGRTKR